MVLPAVVYDALVLGTDELDVNIAQWLGTAAATPTVAGVPEVDITHVDGTAGAGDEIADALLDRANSIETGLTLRQAQRLIAAATAGKLSGAATTTIVIRNAVADSKARITATVDSDGNRPVITTDVT